VTLRLASVLLVLGRLGCTTDRSTLDASVQESSCDCADDGLACTVELCDETGACVHRADDRRCGGGDACGVAACDLQAGGCVVRPRTQGVGCGPNAPFGGPARGCFEGACVPGRAVGLDAFGSLSIPDVGNASPDGFSVLLARVDDRTGDGKDELAAFSVPLENFALLPLPGSVTLFSPATGEIVWQSPGSPGNLSFGNRLTSTPDLDGDGRSDLVCTERVDDVTAVVAIDGSSGAILWRHEEPAVGYLRPVPIVDQDADGADDLVVVAGEGLALLSGVDGTVIRAVAGSYGPSVGTCPDLDGDGLDDIVSDAQPSLFRYVRVVSSATLEDITAFERAGEHVWFSGRTADLDGDGQDEVLLTRSDGVTRVREAQNLLAGTVLWEQPNPRSQPVTTFDLDGDGVRDLITDGRLERSRWRTVQALSGADGTEIFNVEPHDIEGTLAPIDTDFTQISDLDGDGTDDWAMGDDVAGSRIWLFSTRILFY
jgi:hypothetical protein